MTAPGSRARALTWVWALAVLGLHSLPSGLLSRIPGGGLTGKSVWKDKVAHAAMFGALGLAAARGYPRRPWGLLAAGTAYGVALEAYQGWLIPGRFASAADVVSDAAGMALGLGLAALRRPDGLPAGGGGPGPAGGAGPV